MVGKDIKKLSRRKWRNWKISNNSTPNRRYKAKKNQGNEFYFETHPEELLVAFNKKSGKCKNRTFLSSTDNTDNGQYILISQNTLWFPSMSSLMRSSFNKYRVWSHSAWAFITWLNWTCTMKKSKKLDIVKGIGRQRQNSMCTYVTIMC